MEERAQQIYSLSPLATWVPTLLKKPLLASVVIKQSRREESNPRPAVYKTAALPTELRRRGVLITARILAKEAIYVKRECPFSIFLVL